MAKCVLITGYYGFNNTGDEIILASILAQLRARNPQLAATVVSGNPEETSATHHTDAILWSDALAMRAAVAEADLVIVGGGGVFHDYWGFNPNNCLSDGHWGISYYTAPAILAALYGKPVMLYAVGVGPLFSEHAKVFVKAACDASRLITVRDPESAALLAELGVPQGRVAITADPAFAYGFDADGGRRILEEVAAGLPRPVAAVAPRPWNFGVASCFWEQELAQALDLFLDATAGSVLLVPFQRLSSVNENDLAVCERIRSMMRRQQSARLAQAHLSAAQTFALLGACDLVVGMRMHAVIAASLAGAPSLSLCYDPKVDQLSRLLGLEQWAVPLGAIEAVRLARRMREAIERRDPQKLSRTVAQLAQQAEQTADQAVRLLEEGVAGKPPVLTPELGAVLARSLQHQIEEIRALKPAAARAAELEAGRAEKEETIAALVSEKEALTGQLEALRKERQELTQGSRREEQTIAQLTAERDMLRSELAQLRSQQQAFEAYRADKEAYIASLLDQLRRLHSSPLRRLGSLPGRLAPLLLQVAGKLLPGSVLAFARRYATDGLKMIPAGRAEVFEGQGRALRRIEASLIATVLNEGDSIGEWLDALASQTRKPDELVVVDGGSSDDTVHRLRRFAETSGFPVRMIVDPGATIAQGRNLAIQAARFPFIACTDAGSRADPNWLECILAPFESWPETEVVAGWTAPLVRNRFEQAVAELWVPRLERTDFQTYLPSSRTIAFTKAVWEKAGGYPEWLTKWGEDTWFAVWLRNECAHWVAAPGAVVCWRSCSSWAAVARQAYHYGIGDGEAGLSSAHYVQDLRVLARAAMMAAGGLLLPAATLAMPYGRPWPAVALALLGGFFIGRKVRLLDRIYGGIEESRWSHSLRKAALLYTMIFWRVCGYVKGLRNRANAYQRRFGKAKGCAVIFSGVPIDDSGGGQRATQLALELLERGFRVVFLNQYPRYESVDLKLRVRHLNLETGTVQAFDPGFFLKTLTPGQPAFAIAEFPHPAFVGALKRLRAGGLKIVYDLIDDWRTTLGGDWYSGEVEKQYLALSDCLAASSQTLVARLRSFSGRDVLYLPNAVNRRLFTPARRPRPADMPPGEYTIVYVGALWGQWFDWDLLVRLAQAHASAAVVVIGDYRGQCPQAPANLHFLGLKAQRDLPAYLENADVAIIPFRVSPLTHAVSPLKVFEYLAMKLPVVSTPLEELKGMPYVTLAATAESFIEAVHAARNTHIEDAELERFIAQHSWTARLSTLLEALDIRDRQPAELEASTAGAVNRTAASSA